MILLIRKSMVKALGTVGMTNLLLNLVLTLMSKLKLQ